MLRVVISRRWLTALTMAALFAVAGVLLGQWQWHRHEDKAARAERIKENYLAGPFPLSTVLPRAGARLPAAREWTLVTATGRYAPKSLMLVRNRPNSGVFGYEVMVPLELGDGTSLLVNRGWIRNGRSATEPSSVPATPTGDITVTGWLRPGEPSFGRRMPRGQLASINLAEARAHTKASLYGAYLIRRDETRAPGAATVSPEQISTPRALERPDTDLGPHLAYALQWWLAAPLGFVLVLVGARREHLEGPPRTRKTRIWDEEDE